MKLWMSNIMRQHVESKGKWRINRGAEEAVYKVIQENVVAHYMRSSNIGFIEGCITTCQLHCIANKSLVQN